MYGYIYETTCIPTGKKYIGIHKWDKDTIDPNYFGSGIYLKRALKKYGKKNFSCRILEWCNDRKELLEKERYYISRTKAPINENYYNIEDGGQGGHSEYYKQPVTEKQLKNLEYGRHLPASELQKKQLAERRTNIKVSQSTRDKLRAAQLGKRCVNNGVINKYVFESDLEGFLNAGWKLGQLPKDRTDRVNKFKETHYNKDNTEWKKKLSESMKGRRWVTNGIIDIQVKPDKLDYYLSTGFRLGRSKGRD